MFTTILFPIAHSKKTLPAIQKTIDLAKKHHSKLILLVINQEKTAKVKTEQSNSLLLMEVKEFFDKAGLEFVLIERHGNAISTICNVVHEFNIDVIAMTTQEKNLKPTTAIAENLLIDVAPCPVLLFP